MKMTTTIAAASILTFALAAGAVSAGQGEDAGKGSPETSEAYIPGLGEMMGAIQLRHAKLWFAGKARNWELAAYELGEIKEAFGDAAKYQPMFKGRPVAEMIEPITSDAIASMERAISAKDAAQFATAFDHLSDACNTCHQGTGYGFISIQRPTSPPLTNQRFELPEKP